MERISVRLRCWRNLGCYWRVSLERGKLVEEKVIECKGKGSFKKDGVSFIFCRMVK